MIKEFYFNPTTLRLMAIGGVLSLAMVVVLFVFEGRVAIRWQLLLQVFSCLAAVSALQWATFFAWPVVRVSKDGIWIWKGALRKGRQYPSCSVLLRDERVIRVAVHDANGQATEVSMQLLGQADWRRLYSAAREMGVLVDDKQGNKEAAAESSSQ